MKTRLISALLAGALLLGACGDDGIPDDNAELRDLLVESLVDQGVDEVLGDGVAVCISDELYANLDADTFRAVALAETEDEIPAGAEATVDAALEECS
jgi:hypothetical protein